MRIETGNELYAFLAPIKDAVLGTEWFGPDFEPLQASRMHYGSGKKFRPHRHIQNPRIIKRTQEAFLVFKGRLSVEIFDNLKTSLGILEAGPGDLILIYNGYHAVTVLEDTIAYEIKAGQYTYVSEDKEFLNV